MDANTFLAALRQQLQSYPHFRQDEHKLNEGSTPPWITTEREGHTVEYRTRHFAIKWTVSELDDKQRVSLLALPLSFREEIAGPNQSVTLQSESEKEGNFFISVSKKAERRDAVAQAFEGQTSFPRVENGQILLGSIQDASFLGRLLDVAAASAVDSASTKSVPRFWAGGTNWEDTNMVEDFTSNNRWQLGWKADDQKGIAQQCWRYFRQIRERDWFAMKGYGGNNNLRVYYVGRVDSINLDTGELELTSENVPLFRDAAPSVGEGGSWWTSLTPVTSPEAIEKVFGVRTSSIVEDSPVAVMRDSPPLNTILYGPPGTGKTYHSIARAVGIVDGSIAKDRADLQRRFRELCDDERIAFITFHQSYGYEDFVEGIRPVLRVEEEGTARYELAAGLFKRIAIEALLDSLEQVGATVGADFDARWATLVDQIEADLPDRTYPGLTSQSEFRLSVGPSGLIRGTNVKSSKDSAAYICPKHYVEPVFAAFPNQQRVTTTDVAKTLGHGSHTNFVAAVFAILKEIEVRAPEKRAIEAFDEKAEIVQRFLKRGKESGYRLKEIGEWRPYVLLIDEINRGNISKIFGELITLLEPDKRLGAPVEITVTLPYSKERFVVPPNLFVLGTMNTADKSLALLDIALRRRFEFEELQPSFSMATCPALPDDVRKLLDELNHRIALRKDRDHLIGHSYFRDVKDAATFNNVFMRRVIPLLQEYFFNDWEGLRAVLGEDQTSGSAGFIRTLSPGNASWARTCWQWFHDCGGEIDCHKVLLTNYKFLSATTDASSAPDPND